ncbi:alpha/beta hydrolase [Pseudoroseomonas deserti]|uniref:Alpha/beta hydrolase n=1 Tax=Teichococcus deserti TaxID=1817963 RepID=A0A1V2H3A7_9PROT|nr:alpha/beta hydrolase [Pseudoroseomonas deserti]ONG54043.1 alpha/beta hydrolase [Pseudoroseomonas deserti]
MAQPTLVFLHSLGASAGEWSLVCAALPEWSCITLDLPGFGDRKEAGHADVAILADGLADEIRRRRLTACLLVGHSMGGKIATIVASRAAAGEAGLAGILGVVLVAASPPAPEPMEEARRAEMIGWFARGAPTPAEAAAFVDANTARPLPPMLRDRAIGDVRRSSREAWLGWLERGSREDWRDAVGRIAMPALILAGAEDGDLGKAAQRRLNLPHYPQGEVRVVEGAAHMIPYEQPGPLAALIASFAAAAAAAMLPAGFAALLGSDRVSRRTRAAMLARSRPVPAVGQDSAAAWTPPQRAVVAALLAQVLPNCAGDADLLRRFEREIGEGAGDGWRFAELPPDGEAWRRGIATLDALAGGFAGLDRHAQAAWLQRIAAGEAGAAEGADPLSPAQMRLWFEDVRATMARLWVSLPATMAMIGYDGFAVGGDGRRKQGYALTGADQPEAWQVMAETGA